MIAQIIKITSNEQWLAERRKDVTASAAGALLGTHPYVTAYGLWAEKTGKLESGQEENAAMRRGRLIEPVAIQLLKEERPQWKVEYPLSAYYRDAEARLGATPDAFARRPNDDFATMGIVQVKTVSDWAFRQWRGKETGEVELPLWIAVQAIVEADLAGAAWACVAAVCIGNGCEIHILDVPIHPGVRAKVRAAVKDFWSMVESGLTPPIDWKRDGRIVRDVFGTEDGSAADLSGVEGLAEILARYQDAKAIESAAKKDADELGPQIIAALGNHATGTLPGFFVSAKLQHRKEYVAKATSFRRIIVKKES